LKIIAALKDSFDEEHFAVGLSKTAIVNDTLSFVYQFIQPNIREVINILYSYNSNKYKLLKILKSKCLFIYFFKRLIQKL